MASAGVRDEVTCTICLSIYTQPVTLPCGHNFCQGCINKTWDWQEGVEEKPSCPECRQGFRTRPELIKNLRLRNIAEHFLPDQSKQEKTGVYCTYCDSSVPAAKYCALCKACLCHNHVRLHSRTKEHVLTEPPVSPAKHKCSVHDKLLEFHCREDGACICASCCLLGVHQGHRVESLSEASDKEKEKLKHFLEYLIPNKEKTEKGLLKLKGRRDQVQKKAAAEREKVTDLFRCIREWLEALENQFLEEISRQEEQYSLPFSDCIQELETQKEQLSQKIHDIVELCNTADPLSVLQGSDEAEDDEEDEEKRFVFIPPVPDLDKNLLKQMLDTGLRDIVRGTKQMWDYGQKVTYLEMDINTAGPNVTLSDDGKSATDWNGDQDHPETPERFEQSQVLSTRGFSSGRHYWDVEASDLGRWCVGVAYPSMEKEGARSIVGFNEKSWGLYQMDRQFFMGLLRGYHYILLHNNREYQLPGISSCRRIRISLDYEAGLLSFYELGDPIRHLHSFSATFTEPLHAACWLESSWVKIIR